jgi:flagellar basal-body rod modification protein FlgD
MTTVNPNAAPDASIAGQVGNSALAKTSADYNMFLKLLTTQMQNQDPLSPMDTSQYTQQLVQYSQVEQSIEQNTTLKDILGRLSTQDMAQSSSFIGREAQFDSNVSGLSDSAPALWGFTAARPVGALTATITDASGKVVDTRAIDPATSGRLSWDGTLGNGTKAPAGSYSLAIKGTDLSGSDVAVAITSIGTVKQVTTASGAVNLGVNGADMPVGKLIQVSAAS